MNNDRQTQTDYFAPVRRAVTVILLLGLFGLFFLWRIDNPRVEKFRALVIDTFVPSFEWMLRPMTSVVKLAQDYQSYEKLLEQNKELRRELQQMKSWKEAALQLEQENARLLDLNQLRVDSKLTHVSGIVIADSGSPFRQSVLLNIGSRDGIQDGWAAMDGLGLVGRISGVGSSTSRVILLTDNASQIPVIIQPSGQRAILMGDNSFAPPVEFIENVDLLCTFLMKCFIISSATSKSAITPSLIGRMASILPGVRPSINFASSPTAKTFFPPSFTWYATTDGSDKITPLPFT